MSQAQIRLRVGLIVGLLTVTFPGKAAEATDQPNAKEPIPSVQQQLDELKQGQERLFKEVEEIKKLLQAKPARSDFGTKPTQPTVTAVNVRGEPFKGTNTAKVAIVEYSDFGCSFCAKYATNVFPRIDVDYVKPGKIRYYFRDMPEANETNSWFKARAARCAGDEGKFWEMHDLLFAAQEANAQEVVALAQTLGLNADKFNQCLASEKYLVNIQYSAAGAKRMGLYGTPAFLIGTLSDDGDFVRVKKVLVGTDTYESIKLVLDDSLGAAPRSNR